MKIRKYDLPRIDAHEELLEVHLPIGAEILSVHAEARQKPVQVGRMTHDVVAVLCALVDETKPPTTRRFAVLPLELEIPDDWTLEYVGRIQLQGHVFHVLESTRPRLVT